MLQKQPCGASGEFFHPFITVAQAQEFLSLEMKDPNHPAPPAASGAALVPGSVTYFGLVSVSPGGQSCIAAQLLSTTVKLILQLGSTQNELTQADWCCEAGVTVES